MSNRAFTTRLTTRLLSTKEEVSTPEHALSPRERKLFGLTKTRKRKVKKIDTTHLRWV